jgi:hypothetical protein
MPVIRRNDYIWRFFSGILGLSGFEGGELLLSYGKTVITVPTKFQGNSIWLNTEEPEDSIHVCCGEVNSIGAEIIENGFVIYADIKTDKCLVQWFLEM